MQKRLVDQAPATCSQYTLDAGQTRRIHLDLPTKTTRKTLDIGQGGTTVSADPLGRILQLSTYHPQHGIVTAAAFEQFDGAKFCQPEYVRAYRTRMLDMVKSGSPGYGIQFQGQPTECSVEIQHYSKASATYEIQPGLSVTVTLLAYPNGEVTQKAVVASSADTTINLSYILGLGISINRASYGQLTEAGPIPMPSPENSFNVLKQGCGFTVKNRNLDTLLEGFLEIDDEVVPIETIQRGIFASPIPASFSSVLKVPSGRMRTLSTTFKLRPTAPNSSLPAELTPLLSCERVQAPRWRHDSDNASFIVRRSMEYIIGCCTVPVGGDNVALITDHVALPLGWNRDNYWQVRFLLDLNAKLDQYMFADAARVYSALIHKIVKGHLRWVFYKAQRPRGFWHRSYLVTGMPKDGPVFQLDQQCYPILELCDFLEAFPDEHEFVKDLLEGGTASQVITLLRSKRDQMTGLTPTEETPGDDAVEHPFHFSSHVLLWYALTRLAAITERVHPQSQLEAAGIKTYAEEVRSATLLHFAAINPATKEHMWAYLTSGAGDYRFYHDANDIPTLYVPIWGFAKTQEEIQLWYSTMQFGTSAQNLEGYAEGEPFGGLGSVHTPGPWPLGYVQEFVFAQMTKNTAAEVDAWRRLQAAMSWDGLFSEAVDPHTAECTSKAWFSWPGSMVGSAIIRSHQQTRVFNL